jgi:hypothetical protein
MTEVSFIGAEAIIARQLDAAERACTQSIEHLASEQMGAAPVATGTLRASIHVDSIVRGASMVTGTSATGGEASAYAELVHEGTRAHVIKGNPWLAWPGMAHPVHEVHHPGTHANRYMSDPLLANVGYYEQAAAIAAAGAF